MVASGGRRGVRISLHHWSTQSGDTTIEQEVYMEIQRINPPTLNTPLAAYSQVVRRGSIVATAGLIPVDTEGNLVGEGDIAAQTRQTLENIKNALEAAGASLKDVVKTTVFLKDLADYQGMNAVYSEYFGENPAARSTVRADLVLPTLLIKIEALAILDELKPALVHAPVELPHSKHE